jgi:hypothetical protein
MSSAICQEMNYWCSIRQQSVYKYTNGPLNFTLEGHEQKIELIKEQYNKRTLTTEYESSLSSRRHLLNNMLDT